MTFVDRAYLSSKVRTVRTVDVQNDFLAMFVLMNFIHLLTQLICEENEVMGLNKNPGFNPSLLVDRCECIIFGPISDNMTHGGINRLSSGIVGVFISDQTTVNQQPQQCSNTILSILAGSTEKLYHTYHILTK